MQRERAGDERELTATAPSISVLAVAKNWLA